MVGAYVMHTCHVTPLLLSLHWLLVQIYRIDYKISSLCFKVLESAVLSCLSDLLHVYTPSRQLCSSSDDWLFHGARIRTKLYGQRCCAYQGANTWNQLPLSVQHSQSLTSFKMKLKIHLIPKWIDLEVGFTMAFSFFRVLFCYDFLFSSYVWYMLFTVWSGWLQWVAALCAQ